MLGWLHWKIAKLRLGMPRLPSWRVHSLMLAHSATPESLVPNTPPYGALAASWSRYAGWFVPRYGRFLHTAARRYGVPMRSVLDLACGTGLITREIARRAESVVGMDLSEAMVQRAREETTDSRIRYLVGDMRNFTLAETFDAVVCGSDSLNYVTSTDELTTVFRCVYEHLKPGGLFAFDALDDWFLRHLTGRMVSVLINETVFQIYFSYDPKSRICEDRAVFGDTIERHRRIAVETDDVFHAAEHVGLEVADWFRSLFRRRFYVLRRPSGPVHADP